MTRISDAAKAFGVQVTPYNAKPGETVYRVADIFTTRDGSWDPSDKPGSVPQWARDAYLKPLSHPQYNDDGGADHHIFGAVQQIDGNLYPSFPIQYFTWSDGANRTLQNAKKHGWANIVMFASSKFVPERGERGPWAWKPAGVAADTVTGAGMPSNWHVSFWAVWRPEVTPELHIEEPEVVDPPIVTTPEIQQLTLRVARLENIIRQWANFVGDL